MQPTLSMTVRRACVASLTLFALSGGPQALAEEKIKVTSPDKAVTQPELPKTAKRAVQGPAGSTIDLFNGNRSADVGDGGGVAPSTTGRTLDARTAKALVEALTKQKGDSFLIKSPEFESDSRDASNAEDEADDAKGEAERGADGSKVRPDRDDASRAGASERSGRDRSISRDRDTRSGSSNSRSRSDGRSVERGISSGPNAAPGLTGIAQGEKIQVSNPFDARTRLGQEPELGNSSGFDKATRDLAPDLNDANRSAQFREIIKAPGAGGLESAAARGGNGLGAAPMDRAAQFRSLLGGSSPSSSATPAASAALPKAFSASDLSLPAVSDLGPRNNPGLPGVGSGLAQPALTPNFVPPAPAPSVPSAKMQPAILPIPRRF